jgi:hypothetical protein
MRPAQPMMPILRAPPAPEDGEREAVVVERLVMAAGRFLGASL